MPLCASSTIQAKFFSSGLTQEGSPTSHMAIRRLRSGIAESQTAMG
ncbi:hypothetical protein [Oceanicola sp. S124]|nr:hypothetical protein [Oceanicola sp. S124]